MTTGADLLVDAFGRVQEAVHEAVSGLSVEQLHERLDPNANTITWLVWHLTRVQDDHIADVAGPDQGWLRGGVYKRLAPPLHHRPLSARRTPPAGARVPPPAPECLHDRH